MLKIEKEKGEMTERKGGKGMKKVKEIKKTG